MPGTKQKISVTVATDVLRMVDRAASQSGTTRSYMIEQWLRASALRAAERTIDDATAAYYASLRPSERDDADAIARASSDAATRVSYDIVAPRRKSRTRRR